jgi:hypothetical protein
MHKFGQNRFVFGSLQQRAVAARHGFLGLAASMTILAALWPRSWACDDKARI